MNFVSIEGDNLPEALDNIEGILFGSMRSEIMVDGELRIKLFCSTDAITGIRALGLTVTVLQTSDEIDDHLNNIEDDSDGSAIV